MQSQSPIRENEIACVSIYSVFPKSVCIAEAVSRIGSFTCACELYVDRVEVRIMDPHDRLAAIDVERRQRGVEEHAAAYRCGMVAV